MTPTRMLVAAGLLTGALVAAGAIAQDKKPACPVKKTVVNDSVPKINVNGKAVGFC